MKSEFYECEGKQQGKAASIIGVIQQYKDKLRGAKLEYKILISKKQAINQPS